MPFVEADPKMLHLVATPLGRDLGPYERLEMQLPVVPHPEDVDDGLDQGSRGQEGEDAVVLCRGWGPWHHGS